MANCRNPPPAFAAKNWASQTHHYMAQVKQPTSRPAPAPRRTLQENGVKEAAVAYVDSLRPPVEQVDKITENHRQYARYTVDDYKHTYANVNVAGARKREENPDTAATLVFGVNFDELGSKKAAETLKSTIARPKPDIQAYENGYYGSDPAVTMYTARLPEPGAFSGLTESRVPGIALGKSATFTNPIKDSTKNHAGAHDTNPMNYTREGSSSRTALGPQPMRLIAPGAELAINALFKKLLRRFESQKLNLNDFLAGLQNHATTDTVRDLQRIAGSTVKISNEINNQFVPMLAVRSLLHSLRLQLLDTDIEAIVQTCDIDGTGRVSIGALLHYIHEAQHS